MRPGLSVHYKITDALDPLLKLDSRLVVRIKEVDAEPGLSGASSLHVPPVLLRPKTSKGAGETYFDSVALDTMSQ